MTDPVSAPSAGGTPISSALGNFPKKETTPGNSLGQDAFLKLLVAQLRYQDPTNPADGAEFLAQTAQFTQVEKLNELAKSQQSMLSAQLTLSASNMVGRTITYTAADGSEATGVVTSAILGGSDPTLRVGDTEVALSKVKEVKKS